MLDKVLQAQNQKLWEWSSHREECYEAWYQNAEFAPHILDVDIQSHEPLQEKSQIFS